MNIIKHIDTKNMRNIFLYDINNKNNIEIPSTWMKTSLNVYKVYAGHVYNPPYFHNIIVLKSRLTHDDLKMLWNMCLVDYYIILPQNDMYKSFFKSYIDKENKYIKKIKDFIVIKKKDNITYQFPKYRIVDFIIAGTMKGGTTAAITNFCKHPDIGMVKEEIHYFDRKEKYQKGTKWYMSHFDYSKKMVGDKAPDVMYQHSCLELLQIVNPSVKIILFLRNPIDRAYSHWKMTRDLFRNKSTFEDAINDEIEHRWGENTLYDVSFWHHYVQRGLYYEQIERILKYFPKDNLHILITENVKSNMDREYQKVFNFLGVPHHHDNFVEEFSSKSSDQIDKKSTIYKKLKKIYSNDVKELEKFLGYKTKWW